MLKTLIFMTAATSTLSLSPMVEAQEAMAEHLKYQSSDLEIQPQPLEGEVAKLKVSGIIEATEGYRFPDGSLQVTASAGPFYTNRITEVTPPGPYTEVCFKNGGFFVDIHTISESTSGGGCLPGDTGWLIERDERPSGTLESWATAQATCLMQGMRLPEPFEWLFSCENRGTLGLNGMIDNWEWGSNTVFLIVAASDKPGVLSFGNGSCEHGAGGALGTLSGGPADKRKYRCVK